MAAFRLLLQYATAPFRVLLKGPTYLIAAPRRVWGLAPAGRAAGLVALALLACTAIVVATFILSDKPVHGDYLRNPRWIAAVLGVLIATPTATYFLVRLWLQGETSRYPDIDRAWDEGVRALAEEGIALSDLPLYVVLGAPSERDAAALMAATRLTTGVAGIPKGRSPLHWYATSDAVYLVATGLGRLGRLSELATANVGQPRAAANLANPAGATMVAAVPTRATSFPGHAVPTDGPGFAPRAAIMGTLVAGGGAGVTDTGVGPPAPGGSGSMSRREAEEQTDRLAHLMRRLRRSRQPYCADNGVLTILPHAIVADAIYAKEIPDAVRADLETIRAATSLASPVTLLVTGMEAEEGFTELVRRVGAERARSSRFGKGFDVWNAASDENLDALSLHACGSFEDWVYTLFASDDGGNPRSNGKLYTMLSRIRRHIQPRLRGVLVNGYAAEADNPQELPRLFSGCYFAATGSQADQQAFVRSVFDKLDQLAEELQWGEPALVEERTYRWLTWLLTAVNSALLSVVGYLIYRCIALLVQT